MQEKLLLEMNQNLKDVVNIKSDNCIYICGMRQTGKSYLLEHILLGMPKFVIYDGATHQHGQMGLVVRTPEELDAKLTSGENKIVCQPWKGDEKTFDKFCEIIWKHGNMMFAIEEIGNYMDAFSCPEYADMLIRVGRNRGIGIMGINQRPRRIWNTFIALIDHWFVFRTMLPNDITFLCEYLGSAREQEIKELPKRYFYYMNSDEMKPIKCNPL